MAVTLAASLGSVVSVLAMCLSGGLATPIVTGPSTVVSGQTYKWTCEVDGTSSSAPNVFWRFGNGTRLPTSTYTSVGQNSADPNSQNKRKMTSSLTLYITPGAPAFQLSCQAVYHGANTQTSAEVSVTVRGGIFTPVVTGPTKVVDGHTYNWTCVVGGASHRPPTVYWQFGNGTRLDTSTYTTVGQNYTDQNQMEIHEVTSSLTIYIATGAPSFQLSCRGLQHGTNIQTNADVPVAVLGAIDRVVITGPSQVVRGQTGLWTCVVEGVCGSAPALYWQFGNGSRPDKSTYTSLGRSYTDRDNLVIYKTTSTLKLPITPGAALFQLSCRAVHNETNSQKHKYISVTVCSPPSTPTISGPVSVVSGQTYNWTCVVDGASHAAPKIYWQFGNGTRPAASTNTKVLQTYVDTNHQVIHRQTSTFTLSISSDARSFQLYCWTLHCHTKTKKHMGVFVTVSADCEADNGSMTISPARLVVTPEICGTGADVTVTCQSPRFQSAQLQSDKKLVNLTISSVKGSQKTLLASMAGGNITTTHNASGELSKCPWSEEDHCSGSLRVTAGLVKPGGQFVCNSTVVERTGVTSFYVCSASMKLEGRCSAFEGSITVDPQLVLLTPEICDADPSVNVTCRFSQTQPDSKLVSVTLSKIRNKRQTYLASLSLLGRNSTTAQTTHVTGATVSSEFVRCPGSGEDICNGSVSLSGVPVQQGQSEEDYQCNVTSLAYTGAPLYHLRSSRLAIYGHCDPKITNISNLVGPASISNPKGVANISNSNGPANMSNTTGLANISNREGPTNISDFNGLANTSKTRGPFNTSRPKISISINPQPLVLTPDRCDSGGNVTIICRCTQLQPGDSLNSLSVRRRQGDKDSVLATVRSSSGGDRPHLFSSKSGVSVSGNFTPCLSSPGTCSGSLAVVVQAAKPGLDEGQYECAANAFVARSGSTLTFTRAARLSIDAPTRPADLFLECPFKNEITCVVQTSAVQRAPCSHPVARIQLLKVPATDGHHKHLADSPFPACPSNWTRRGPHQARCLGVAPCNTRLYQFRLGPGTEAAGLRCVASCVSGAGSSLLTSMNQTACGKAASALEGGSHKTQTTMWVPYTVIAVVGSLLAVTISTAVYIWLRNTTESEQLDQSHQGADEASPGWSESPPSSEEQTDASSSTKEASTATTSSAGGTESSGSSVESAEV